MLPVIIVSCVAFLAVGHPQDRELSVPEGFQISRFADGSLATDITSMTIDSQGRVVVSGPGYIKILRDTDQDGIADRASLFSELPKSGAFGLCAMGDGLLCTGDGGLWKWTDTDGDYRADLSEQWAKWNDSKDSARSIVRGPDGWFYVICSDSADISREHITASHSPVVQPVGGVVLRFSPDGKTCDVYAHGFRHPRGLTFYRGRLFTVDSDDDSDRHLPWYSKSRLFDVAQGMEHGWVPTGKHSSWGRPEWHYDNVDRIVEFGHQTPAAICVYQHRKFPHRYQQGMFVCFPASGEVQFIELEPQRSSYRGSVEQFLHTTEAGAFIPVDLAVGPQGELYVASGGCGRLSGVFCIRQIGDTSSAQEADDPLKQVLAAPQPLSSWSRAVWHPQALKLGKEPFVKALLDRGRPVQERIRCVEILTELFGGPMVEIAKKVVQMDESLLTARVIWSLSRGDRQRLASSLFAQLTRTIDLNVLRAAWEAIATLPEPLEKVDLDWSEALLTPDRRVRWAMLLAARGPAGESFTVHADHHRTDNPSELSSERLAELWVHEPPEQPAELKLYMDECLAFFVRAEGVLGKLEAVRLIQRGLGDVNWERNTPSQFPGYSARFPDRLDERTRRVVAGVLALEFPSSDELLNRELARVFSMLESKHSRLQSSIASLWTDGSLPEDDIHYLIVASKLPGPREESVTAQTADMLVRLHAKLREREAPVGANFHLWLHKVVSALCQHDTRLAQALASHSRFGETDHLHFIPILEGETRIAAIRKFVHNLQANEEEGRNWSPELVRLTAELPAEEALPLLRQHLHQPQLREEALLGLARFAQLRDRGAFVTGLASVRAEVVAAVTKALRQFPATAAPEDIKQVRTALQRFSHEADHAHVRKHLADLLHHWTESGEKHDWQAAEKASPDERAK